MSFSELLVSGWHWKPEVLGGVLAALVLYVRYGRTDGRRLSLFLTALVVLVLALMSPLDTLAHTYLFSAHMIQHMLITLVAPPLLVLAMPDRMWSRSAPEVLPLVAWLLATGVLAAWHLPALYGAALKSDAVHVLQHACFIGTGLLFWVPILASEGSRFRAQPWVAMVYLTTAMLAGSVLGIAIAFASPGLYPHYLNPTDHNGLLHLVREQWRISPSADQQAGGMLMWIPGGIAYSFALFRVFGEWMRSPEEDGEPAPLRIQEA